MTPSTLPIHEIQIGSRQRFDLGNIAELASSLKTFGLIQPIVITQDKQLIAGGRRLEAAKRLGWTSIPVVYRENLDQETLAELELEENIRRKSMHWTEECLAIARIHAMKRKKGLHEGWEWGQQQTADMMGFSVGAINYILKVASELKKELSLAPDQRRCHQCDNASEAFRTVILADEQKRVMSYLAEKQKLQTNTKEEEKEAQGIIKEYEELKKPDALASARIKYESNPHNVIPFDVYWKEKEKAANEAANTIYISNRLFYGDSIEFMLDPENKERFDHIITDIPYAIDMENLSQDNVGMSSAKIDTVRNEHDIEENLDLARRFFPAAFACTRPHSFVITFCDYMNWQLMYDLAVEAGFKVQRWPFIWHKTHSCMNSTAMYNLTKDHEPAIICRKPSAVTATNGAKGLVSASGEKARKETNHPFAKAYEVTAHLISTVSLEGQTILDPFAGGGSMILEALRMGRHIYACEKNAIHFNQLTENIKAYYRTLNPNFIFK
jgi:ParB family transcriptional regulator, chromosome partitioning protein